jgi:CHAD domain-containing protein
VFSSPTPYTLLVSQVETLRSHLPGVRDGNADSVHDARVAGRRIRELLSLNGEATPTPTDELKSRFRKIGRALGRVRDADVRVDLLSAMEERIPHAAPWLVTVRQEQERSRRRLARRLIKRLERFDIEGLLDHMVGHGSPLNRTLWRSSRTGHWRRDLTQTLCTRARVSAEAIEHAAGVYFPKRVHAARIALKKLRYAMETAKDTGRDDLEEPLRDLKKSQDVLGDLHDRHTLIVELPSAEPVDGTQPNPFVTLVKQALEAETDKLHGRYLDRRERLLEICDDAQAIRIGGLRRMPSLLSAGALALGTGLLVTHRR